MNGSLKIGTAFGIPIRIHWTFLLLPYVLWLGGSEPATLLAWIVVVFGCVLLHELGHSLVAKGFGIRVLDISFWPLGGMARMSEIPESPRIEGLVAIAGPAVNLALAGLGLLSATLTGVLGTAGVTLSLWFAGINLLQGTFNLLPAFPMDGGRILRAFLARKRDWVSATELAVRVGRVVAGLMLVGSLAMMVLLPGSVCILPLITLFIWIAGGRELLSVRLRHGLAPFGRGFAGPRPATAESASAGGAGAGPAVEPGAARRPAAWERPNSGFSDESIRELERYRGRLRPPAES